MAAFTEEQVKDFSIKNWYDPVSYTHLTLPTIA